MSNNIPNQKTFIFVIVYIMIVLCDLICSSHESYSNLRNFTKPSIVGSLIAFLFINKKSISITVFRLMNLALIFSLLGDFLLLFTDKSQNFFIAGLASFLLAHIVYIIVFNRERKKQLGNWIFPLLTGAYGFGLFSLLHNKLEEMLIPVILYMIVILLMANTSFLRSNRDSQTSYLLVFVGALFFMLSDSLLAINMFYKSLPLSNIWIMTTYAIAQFLIVYGIVKQKTSLSFA